MPGLTGMAAVKEQMGPRTVLPVALKLLRQCSEEAIPHIQYRNIPGPTDGHDRLRHNGIAPVASPIMVVRENELLLSCLSFSHAQACEPKQVVRMGVSVVDLDQLLAHLDGV